MIPKVGDKVLVNPVFLRQYGICQGIEIITLFAHNCRPDATDLLYPRAPQSRDWGAPLTVTEVVANNSNPDKAHFLVKLSEFPKGIWLEPTGKYADCLRCRLYPCSLSGNVPFFVLSVATIVAITPDQIKRANTIPNIKFCAACGGLLKDPGMGPTYKHCPKCEP